MKYILLWIESPLQSWGSDSKFWRRDSLRFPTKSGILGLILSSMGVSGAQNELLSKLSSKKMNVNSYVHSKIKDDKPFKLDKEPLLIDYHVVGNGYNDKDKWQKLLIPKNSEGNPTVGGGSKITYRYYLQDARFAVILETAESMTEIVCESLKNPIFDVYFGRKNCVPTEQIFQGCFDDISEAYKKAEDIAKTKELIEDFQVFDGEKKDCDESFTLNDVPIQFGEIKRYRDRRVSIKHHE
jgi:CRISPR system Cascade subunit CasD